MIKKIVCILSVMECEVWEKRKRKEKRITLR